MLQVFFYVSRAKLDLSLFVSDQASLIESLRTAHRSIRFQLSSHKRKVTIEGPFAAIKALREDLVRRASQLKSTVPTGTITPRESPLNPRVISHHEFAGSVSCSDSKAKREPAGLPALLQSTGGATCVQSLLSNAETQNSPRQKVQSVCDPDTDEEEELKAGSKLRLTTEYGTERDRSKNRQMFRQERNPGTRSSSPGLYLQHTEKVPAEDDISQKHTRTNTISPTRQSRGKTHLDSHYSSTDYVKEAYQNTSAVTNNIFKDVSRTAESSAGNKEYLSAGRPENPEDKCMWVDSNIFRYIEKLDKKEYDRCLRGLNASVQEVEGSDLVQICLTENQPFEASLRIQQALEELKTLVEHWQSTLRVHEIHFKKGEHPKHKLIQICKGANIADLYNDVLYMVEDSKIIVIGPSVSSFLFHKKVERSLNP